MLVVTSLDPLSLLVTTVPNPWLLELTTSFLNYRTLLPSPPRHSHIIVVDNEIGTTKITILIEVILDRIDPLFRVIVRVTLGIKALQSQLFIAPVPDDVVVLTENVTIALGQLYTVETVTVFFDQLVRVAVESKVIVVLGRKVVQVRTLFLTLVNVVLYFCSVHPDSPFTICLCKSYHKSYRRLAKSAALSSTICSTSAKFSGSPKAGLAAR